MHYSEGTEVFDGWMIEKKIGEGSYGKVYKITKTEYGIVTTSALKVISIPQSQTEIKNAYSDGLNEQSVTAYFKGFVDEIVKEIIIMSKVKSHPNVVSYEDHKVIEHEGEIGWDILIRMEYLTPFVDYQISHDLTEADVAKIGIDLSSALDYCHSKGLIHRDVKPENIFVNDAGIFKLGDFGVAKTIDRTIGGMSKKGTEVYMAPEVYIGKPYGASVDTYSLGLVLYRLLNGNRLPFLPLAPNPISFEDRENSLICRMRGDDINPPTNASSEFAEVVLKACAYDSKDRFSTAGELNAALMKIKISRDYNQDDSKNNNTSQAYVEKHVVEKETFEATEDNATIGIWGMEREVKQSQPKVIVEEKVKEAVLETPKPEVVKVEAPKVDTYDTKMLDVDDFDVDASLKKKNTKGLIIGLLAACAVILIIVIICANANSSSVGNYDTAINVEQDTIINSSSVEERIISMCDDILIDYGKKKYVYMTEAAIYKTLKNENSFVDFGEHDTRQNMGLWYENDDFVEGVYVYKREEGFDYYYDIIMKYERHNKVSNDSPSVINNLIYAKVGLGDSLDSLYDAYGFSSLDIENLQDEESFTQGEFTYYLKVDSDSFSIEKVNESQHMGMITWGVDEKGIINSMQVNLANKYYVK